MKKTAILFVCLISGVFTQAQKSFQGEITYRLHASAEDKNDAELKVLFGLNKLKLRFKEKEEYDKDELIVLFDSAATYIINADNKTFKKKLLHINQPVLQRTEKKSILGYGTTAFVPESNGLGNLLGGLMSASNAVFYLADSFYYSVPDILQGNIELVMVQKNRIVLGADVQIGETLYGASEEKIRNKNLVTAEAISINPMAVNDSNFLIPADYIDIKRYEEVTNALDSSAVKIDSVAIVAPAKKATAKKPVKSSKPKTAVKSSAVRRKE